MTAAVLSLLDLLTQALPGVKGAGVTIKIAVTFALVSVIVVGGLGAAARQQTKMTTPRYLRHLNIPLRKADC